MREIVLDTETTGLDPLMSDRVVEIAALELINHVPTGNHYHVYINPERDMPAEAFAVHGLSAEFLADKPLFRDVADGFLEFIGDAPLVIHNGAFDLKFLNAEFARLRRIALPFERLIDTLSIARTRFPGAPASLDALCRRYSIDLSVRTLHGALVDCQLLAAVYLEMVGGRQPGLTFSVEATSTTVAESEGGVAIIRKTERVVREPRPHAPTEEERERHRMFISTAIKAAIWLRRESA